MSDRETLRDKYGKSSVSLCSKGLEPPCLTGTVTSSAIMTLTSISHATRTAILSGEVICSHYC